MRVKHVWLPLYRMNYYFCVGFTRDEYLKFWKKQMGEVDEIAPYSQGRCVRLDRPEGQVIVIWTASKAANDSNLVHECLHAANMTLEARGIVPCFRNDEAQAYLLTWIFEQATAKK